VPTDLFIRRADTVPTTYNPETRTFDALISTGAPVARTDGRGPYIERLDLSGVDLDSLVGLTVLDGHRQGGSEHAVGVIVAARNEAAGIVATVRLSAADDVKSIALKVGEGTLRGVSIGYSAASRSESATGGKRTITVRPKIHELSIVAIPADPQALIRKEDPLPTQNISENEPPITVGNDNTAHRAQVRAIARAAGQSAEWADEQIDAEADITTIRAAAFQAMTSRQSPGIRTQSATPANDDPTVIRQRMAEALAARMGGPEPTEAARQYVNLSLHDMARHAVSASGQGVTMLSREELIQRAMHGTSDFPMLLTESGNRVLRPAYESAASPLKTVARRSSAPDFRDISTLQFGEFGKLKEVTEHGEITATTTAEAKEAYRLKTFARLFNVSRKAIINDDLGAFGRWASEMGRAAAETEADELVALLTQSAGAGPLMQDGKRLFSADHGNLSTDTVGQAGSDNLDNARSSMRKQKGLDGTTPVNVVAKYLLIGPDQEKYAEQRLATINAAETAFANPFANSLTILVEPRITNNDWRFFADPAVLPAIEYAYLSSAQGPQLSSRDGWEVLGREFRCVLDFGCGAVDWRGVYRIPGTA